MCGPFAEKAKGFYLKRGIFRKDANENFEPCELLNIDFEKTTNKVVMESEITRSF